MEFNMTNEKILLSPLYHLLSRSSYHFFFNKNYQVQFISHLLGGYKHGVPIPIRKNHYTAHFFYFQSNPIETLFVLELPTFFYIF